MSRFRRSVGPRLLLLAASMLGAHCSNALAATASFPEFTDPNPHAGNGFGTTVVVLSGGNVVITSPGDDQNAIDAGAVYLFNGSTGALISALRGSHTGDHVGGGGVVKLTNGHFVVQSPEWDNETVVDAGASTFGSGTTGANGVVSSSNSLVGSTAYDQVGSGGVTALPNGNYVVISSEWDNAAVANAGAVTFCNGSAGFGSTVSPANSLVGDFSSDAVGSAGVYVVGNSNYVVCSPTWHSPADFHVGAVTWCSGTAGRTGTISSANSFIGAIANDNIGGSGAKVLTNGNYVVSSQYVDIGGFTDAGAVTFCPGNSAVTGTVSAANSLVGLKANDNVGSSGVFPLTNGNYVVNSFMWDNGALQNAGASTWCSGTTGRVGAVSSANSLVGGSASDNVGSNGVIALTNGHYVLLSPAWQNGAVTFAGAATWCNGTTGATGLLSAANSLTSNQSGARIGVSGVALSNGNYVTSTSYWDNGGALDAGAVTWGNGTTGTTGIVSAANSLVGSTTSDNVGANEPTTLPNGNYVVQAPYWNNGAIINAGAVTWCNGTTGRSGAVSSANSLVGSTANDNVGVLPITVLDNWHYVVCSPNWDNGATTDAGAVTWCSYSAGAVGPVSAVNSLVGTHVNDLVGVGGATALSTGHFVVGSPYWDNGVAIDAGAATWCSGLGGTVGAVTTGNSLVGSSLGDKVGSVISALPDGSYAVRSLYWDNGDITDAGAVTWASAGPASIGTVSQDNSVFGFKSNSSLADIQIDPVRSIFAAPFLTEGGGHVRVGPLSNFTIAGVLDIPGDQGGWVRAVFARSPYDHPLASTPVQTYGVWRRIPGSVPQSANRAAGDAPIEAIEGATLEAIRSSLGSDVTTTLAGGSLIATISGGSANSSMPAGAWELLTTIPAFTQSSYIAVIPTITNLTSTEFLVTAHTGVNTVWFTTPTVFGQSVDNLAPAQPSPFAGAYATGNTHLTWGANSENDLMGYRLYRGSSAGFTPSLANRIATPSGTTYDDVVAGGYVYKLTAVDVNGNESPVATVIPAGTTGVEEGPVAFALDGVRPNPANGRALNVAFALPMNAPAKLELLDVSGRRVAVRDVGVMGAGRHSVNLSEVRAIPAGLYWARLTQGAMQRSVRVAVVE